jgi:tripartite-type tricarboxylate transporter receptor subunit TctC
MKKIGLLIVALAAILLGVAGGAHAQERYPVRPITFVVGFGPGGSSDLFARFLSEYARKARNASIVVENRIGLAGAIAIERLSKSPPDGYTVGIGSISSLWVLPQMQKMNYDPLRDLDYIAKLFTQPLPLYVRTESPFKTYAELLGYARANPGKLRWGTAGSRGIGEIIMDSGFHHAGVETTTVPYKAGVDANFALLGGHIDAVASTDFGPMLQAGRIRLLVESGPLKIPGQPNVPTFRELKYPLSVEVFYGVVGPANLPAEVTKWWDSLLAEAVKTKEYADFCEKTFSLPFYEDSATFRQFVMRGYPEFGKAIAVLPPRPQ